MRQNAINRLAGFFVLLIFTGAVAHGSTDAAKISMISINQLKLILDNPQVVVIDVRTIAAWRKSPVKIKGAVRGAPKQFESWSKDFPRDKALVLY